MIIPFLIIRLVKDCRFPIDCLRQISANHYHPFFPVER